jgi:hypothetical protein
MVVHFISQLLLNLLPFVSYRPITNCQDTLRTRSYNLTFFFSVLGRAIGRVMSQPAVMSRTTGRLSTRFLTALPYADLQAQYKVRAEIQKRRLAI